MIAYFSIEMGISIVNSYISEEHRLRVFEKRLLRIIFGSQRDEVIEDLRKLYNEQLRNLYCSLNNIRMIKSRKMRLAGYVGYMGRKMSAYRVFIREPEGNQRIKQT
jgi:hypothetical protein